MFISLSESVLKLQFKMVFLSVILITSWCEGIIERRKCLKMWSSLPVVWTDIAMFSVWPNIFLNRKLIKAPILYQKLLWIHNFLDPTSFVLPTFFWTHNFFCTKNYFHWKFFSSQNIFWTKNFFRPKNWLRLKNFWTEEIFWIKIKCI